MKNNWFTPFLGMTALVLIVLSNIAIAKDIERIVPGSETLSEAKKASPEEHAAKHADPTYICPMHPQVQQGEEGSCPICGMNLVLKSFDPNMSSGKPIVSVSSSTAQSMGVRTGKVTKRTLSRAINTVGYVRYDESKLFHIHARTNGWIKDPVVKVLGDKVKKSQRLASYYSPDIYTAQEDYLTALRNTSDRQKQIDVLTRLQVMEVSESVIRTLETTATKTPNVPLTSPIDGVVTEIGVRDGMYVTPSKLLYAIADLSSVWVIVDVFPDQLSWIRKGAQSTMRVDALPSETWSGRVDYIYPELNEKTRTLQVRLKFKNDDGLLKPNMFASVKINNRPVTGAVTIPREALIPSSEGFRVVKVTEENHYQPVDVKVGIKTGNRVEITEGLEVGDEIVLSGQFLIDSESNLQASFQRMSQ
jgi:Cu(I)/Ag(I) efflux system membrane fusion protein